MLELLSQIRIVALNWSLYHQIAAGALQLEMAELGLPSWVRVVLIKTFFIDVQRIILMHHVLPNIISDGQYAHLRLQLKGLIWCVFVDDKTHHPKVKTRAEISLLSQEKLQFLHV